MEVARPASEQCYCALAHSRPALATFAAPSDLIAFLHSRKSDNGIPVSDGILAELLRAAADNGHAGALRDLLLLAFIPMLHASSRQVAVRYPSLSPDDISQHVVLSLLEILGSPEFYERSSHIAFAIARVLKRNTFEWAARETRRAMNPEAEETVPDSRLSRYAEEPFERVALLRHFLGRCHAQGLLTVEELELLVQFKLESVQDRNAAGSVTVYSNASRQRMKRLLHKLRRIAREPAVARQLRLF
jgi:hypothetical protein